MKIYLAGGMKSGWQDEVISGQPYHVYFDPRSHGLTSPKNYTEWDLNAIRKCDLVISYLEADNPGGYNAALELGYACALNKKIIFINEKGTRYVEMLIALADFYFSDLGLFMGLWNAGWSPW